MEAANPSAMADDVREEAAPPIVYDAGKVIMMVGDPNGNIIPMPVPAVFQQLFGIIGDLDRRLLELEEKQPVDKGKIITL